MFCGCPVTWSSKLQMEIALSTTESEYVALSTAILDILPLRLILQDIAQYSFISFPASLSNTTFTTSTVQPSKVYEDNTA
jgi:hypothetical protein